ncbi:MAG: hypothetical protein ACRBBP_04150 [Bdellovibrionales bacterium]
MKKIITLLSTFVISLLFSITASSYEQSDASRKYDAQSGRGSRKSYDSDRYKAQPRKTFNSNKYKDSTSRTYKPKFKSNYSKYKKYSPEKKTRYKSNWSSFKKGSNWKGMSNEQKQRLRRKVLDKKKRKSYN